MDSLVITSQEAGQRLDKILAERYAGLQSRTYFQKLIGDGLVLLNGDPVKKRACPDEGDEVEVEFTLSEEISLQAEEIPLNILYEDEHLLAINKPIGMVVHPAPGNWSGTFVNALLFHCQQRGIELSSLEQTARPGIVHRLDKDTSGVLLAAKTAQAQQKLVALFSSRKVHKEYLAVCLGNPGRGTVEAPIGRDPKERKKMAVVEGGRAATSHYITEHTAGELSLVRIHLVTGRTHQARVHMQHLNCPILGDTVYGNSKMNQKFAVARQLLHAELLKFVHPIQESPLCLKAAPPEDLQRWIDRLTGEKERGRPGSSP